jgi:hypothetical protein
MKNMFLKKAFASIGIGAMVLLPSVAMAANVFTDAKDKANSVATGAGINQGTQDPTVIIGKIVNVILSLLGVIFLLLVLYAGFLWMTAAGDEKKVGQAKNILSQAVVGLIIIVAGYAISNFVLDSLVKVTS